MARTVGANTVHLTVNSNAQDNPLLFFKKKFGFVEKASWPTKHGQEYLLYLNVKPVAAAHRQSTDVPDSNANGSRLQPDMAPPQGNRKRRLTDAALEHNVTEPSQHRPRRLSKHHQITLKGPYIRCMLFGPIHIGPARHCLCASLCDNPEG